MNAAEWLLEGAKGRAAEPAFVEKGARITHADFSARVRASAARCAPGTRVAILAANSIDAAAALLGVMLAGATAVPLPSNDAPARLARMLARAKPAGAFADARGQKTLAEIAPELPILGPDGDARPATVRGDTPALVLFTSGSTGEPRGVVLSHRNIVANTTSILAALPIRPDDRMMAVLPFYYSFGASVLFTHVRAGACLVINNQLMFADRVLQEMQSERCTSFAGVPGTYQLLLRRSSLPKMTFPDLRYVQQAGGRLAPTFVAELAERLPTTQVWLMYGQTEATARLTVLDPARLADKGHTIGKPIPGVTLELDQDGQILARGENIALGYLDEPEATADTFRDGALRTGDLGRIDDEGFFVITDRAKDFLKCAGYRVAMKEIEDVLVAFPGTVEAAVVGIPDELQGEAVQAFLVHPRGEEARADFDVHCKRALLPHLQPRVVVFLDALPKTAAGKLARPQLRELASSGASS